MLGYRERWWAALVVNAVSSAVIVIVIAMMIRSACYGQLDRDHLVHAAPCLWLPALAMAGVVCGTRWSGALCLGACVALGGGWAVALTPLPIAVLTTDAWRRREKLDVLLRFTMTWAAAGFLACVVADGLSFDLSIAASDHQFRDPAVVVRVALELAAAAFVVLLVVGGRTFALVGLVASIGFLVAHTMAMPSVTYVHSGGCLAWVHTLRPGSYGRHAECSIAAALAVVPWVGPALRALFPRAVGS